MAAIPQISVESSQSSQSTLQRLADSMRLRNPKAISRAPEPDLNISRRLDRADFEDLDSVIKGLGPLVKRLKAIGARYEFQPTEVRDAAIARALQPFSPDKNKENHDDDLVIDLNSQFVLDAAIDARKMEEGDSLGLIFEITKPQDSAGAFVDFGSNLAGDSSSSSYRLMIGGSQGTQEMAFTSGQTLGQIAAAINSFADTTGVQAVASATGISLRSIGSGAGSFVSVRLADSGTSNAAEFTLFELTGSGDTASTAGNGTSFASNPLFEDFGTDIAATINSQQADLVGNYWVTTLDGVDIAIDVNEQAVLAAGGQVDLGSISKPDDDDDHDDDHSDEHDDDDDDSHSSRGKVNKENNDFRTSDRKDHEKHTKRDDDSHPEGDGPTKGIVTPVPLGRLNIQA